MKVSFWMIGKTAEPYLEKGMSIYEKRIPHYLPFQSEIFPDIKGVAGLSQEQLKLKEEILEYSKMEYI